MSFNLAAADEQERKLFVGGLSKSTEDDQLREYFGKYGEVVDCSIMRDQEKRSRGFGFILFDDATTVDKIIAAKKDGNVFNLDDRSVEIKRALPKVPRGTAGAPRAERLNKKIFVGGLPNSVTEEDVRSYFENFGRVNEVQMIKDRETGRLRGFSFITFDDEDSADKCLQRRTHEIGKKMCEVKRAQIRNREPGPGGDKNAPNANQNQGGTGNVDALGMSEVNRLIQQAFIMGQSAYQPQQPQPSNVLLQALMGQQAAAAPAPAPVVAPAPTTSPALSQLAQLLQAGGIDTNALGTLLKDTDAQRPPAPPATSMDVYATPQSNYSSQAANYGPTKDDYPTAAKRAYRPY